MLSNVIGVTNVVTTRLSRRKLTMTVNKQRTYVVSFQSTKSIIKVLSFVN